MDSGAGYQNLLARIGDGELLSDIVGSTTNYHTAPYYLTEEFVSVYRMHPLIPDQLQFYSHQSGQLQVEKDFKEVFGKQTRAFVEAPGWLICFTRLVSCILARLRCTITRISCGNSFKIMGMC